MKVPAFLVLFGAGVVVLVLFLTSPAQLKDGRGKHPEDDHHLTPSELARDPGPETSESVPARISRRSKHLSGEGVEDERTFFGEVRDWARADPDAAIAWAQQQPDSDDARKEALTDACFQIAQTDPQRAVMLAEQFKLSRNAVLQNLAQQWAAKDLTSARQWIAEQPDDDQRNALVTGVTFVWSQAAPADAAQYVVDQMTPGSARDEAVMMVLHQWASMDAVGATAWIERFPESPLRDQALDELATAVQRREGTTH